VDSSIRWSANFFFLLRASAARRDAAMGRVAIGYMTSHKVQITATHGDAVSHPLCCHHQVTLHEPNHRNSHHGQLYALVRSIISTRAA